MTITKTITEVVSTATNTIFDTVLPNLPCYSCAFEKQGLKFPATSTVTVYTTICPSCPDSTLPTPGPAVVYECDTCAPITLQSVPTGAAEKVTHSLEQYTPTQVILVTSVVTDTVSITVTVTPDKTDGARFNSPLSSTEPVAGILAISAPTNAPVTVTVTEKVVTVVTTVTMADGFSINQVPATDDRCGTVQSEKLTAYNSPAILYESVATAASDGEAAQSSSDNRSEWTTMHATGAMPAITGNTISGATAVVAAKTTQTGPAQFTGGANANVPYFISYWPLCVFFLLFI